MARVLLLVPRRRSLIPYRLDHSHTFPYSYASVSGHLIYDDEVSITFPAMPAYPFGGKRPVVTVFDLRQQECSGLPAAESFVGELIPNVVKEVAALGVGGQELFVLCCGEGEVPV